MSWDFLVLCRSLKYAAFDVEQKDCNAQLEMGSSVRRLPRFIRQAPRRRRPCNSKYIASAKAFQPSFSCEFQTRQKTKEKNVTWHTRTTARRKGERSLCNYLIFNSHRTPSKNSAVTRREEENLLSERWRNFPLWGESLFEFFICLWENAFRGRTEDVKRDFFMR